MEKKPVSKLGKPAKKAPVEAPKSKVPAKTLKSPGAVTKDWLELEKNVLICAGNYSQAHKKFKGHNQQSAAVCIVACAISSLRSMNTWTKDILDYILEVGTNLHLKTKQLSENRCATHFKPPEIYKYFFLKDIKISMKIGVDTLTERITRDAYMLQKMEDMFTRFFKINTSGILAIQESYFAIWKFDKYFFIFDPTEHNMVGGKWVGVPGMGFCYCIRTTNLKALADILFKNCPLKQFYRFTMYPCSIEKMVQVDTTPPESLDQVKPFTVDASAAEVPKTQKSLLKPEPKPKVEPKAQKPSETKIEVKKSVSKSVIPPERPKLESVTNFVEVFKNKMGILRASTHQRDPKFSRYVGAQSMGNAIAALTMLRQYKSKHWIKNILDDVLRLGEKIHHEGRNLKPGEALKKITLNEVNYSPKIDKVGAMGRLLSDDDKILNLEQALTNTLIDIDCCILLGPQVLAIWKEDKKFYMFDPEERDAFGKVVPQDEVGFACVTWYTNLSDLVTTYIYNLPKSYRNSRFMISKVIIKDYAIVAENWYNFNALTYNKWILRGSFSQQDRRFPPESRNAQCTANATMALTFKELKEEKDWGGDTVDAVLTNGDEFYRGCVEYLKECGKFQHKYLMVDELKRNFDLEKKRVKLEIDDCLVNGVINAKSETGIPNLKKGFEQFFLDSDAGIVTANLQSMAVWKKGDIYYYYDSHSRNEKGVVCGFGTACILRLVTLEDLTKAMTVNLGCDRDNFYNISRVVVKLMDLTEDGVVKPPLNSYEAVNDLIAILRSNSCHKDKKFDISAGKQEVPMCLAAVAFNSLTPSEEWTQEDVDQILNLGNTLYVESMEANYGEDVPEEVNVDEVSTNNVKKELKIGTNRLELEFEELASGNLEENLTQAIESLSERIASEGNGVFQTIIESQYVIASMWRDDTSIYLFDPRPRDEKGEVYGKDDWSVKVVIEEGQNEGAEDAEDAEEVEEKKDDWEDDEDKDEMAGGDNLGEPEEEEEQENVPPLEEEDEGGDDEEEEEVKEEAPPVEKKGSEFWRQKEEEGKACVLRFSRVEDLVQHILENSPPNQRQEIEFVLKEVKITNTPLLHEVHQPDEEKKDEFVGDWNYFKEIDYGKWILRAPRNYRDALFPVSNRGKQDIPMCMVALVFSCIYPVDRYNEEVVDRILMYGDRLMTLALKLRSKELKSNKDLGLSDEEIEEILKDTTFSITEFPQKLCIGETQVSWEVTQELMKGDITSKIPDTVHNLVSGLGAFLEMSHYGLLLCRDYPVAVFKHEDMVYMFDPHGSGPSGVKSPIGVACITRFKKMEDLEKVYLENLPRMGNNFFEIHSFTFTKDKCVRERHPEVKEFKAPPTGGFKEVTAGKGILRGDVKLDCSKFDRGVHIHSAPIAFVALALSLSKDPETWTRLIVNEILTVGEELYNECLDHLGDKFDPWSERLDVRRVNTDFKIGKLKVNAAIRFTEQKGIVDVKNSKILNLRQGLEKFFEENSHGILVADKFVLPVWEHAKGDEICIYSFDPNSRGVTGLPGQGGVACVMKFCNAKVASDHFMACMMDIDKTKTPFSIVPVEIVVGTAKSKRKVCSPLDKTKGSKITSKSGIKSSTATQSTLKSFKTAGSTTLKPTTTRMGTISKPGTTTMRTSTTAGSTTLKPTTTRLGTTTMKTATTAGTSTAKFTTLGISKVSSKPPASTTMKSKVAKTCPDKSAVLEQQKAVRKIAEEERSRKEAKRCALLGRSEMYEINANQAIVRGNRAIVKDRELPVNIVAFVFMRITPDLSKWKDKHIELILETGYQLYVDSFNTYKPETAKLSLQHVLRRVLLKDLEVKIDIKKPIIGGIFTRGILLNHLTQLFALTNFFILNYEGDLVSLYFKGGYYYLFDPYSRDLYGNQTEDGCAMLMRFGDLENLVDKVIRNLQKPDSVVINKYALIVPNIVSAQPLSK